MTTQDRERIQFLRERIRKNLAKFEDYEEYERLLLKNGITKEQIDKYLKSEHLTGYDELIRERNKYQYPNINLSIEKAVVAGLIGLGFAVVLNAIFNRRD